MNRILLIEDDKKISEILQMYLSHQAFDVTCAYNVRSAQAALEHSAYQLVVLDVMLPDGDGFQMLRDLREGCYFLTEESTSPDTPVLMLTALGQTDHIVKGLGFGADDYVSKPFEPAELVARITAILKRTSPASRRTSILKLGELEIELTARIVRSHGEELALNRKEYDMLLFLCRNVQKVFSREQLIAHIWSVEFDGSDRTVDVCVQRVRSKLKKHKTNLQIKTVWGVGYRLEELKG